MDNGEVPYDEVSDEAAFYGPKIDVQIWSAIGREFTLATNQVDFAQPDRLDLSFTTSEGTSQTPLCIHRAPLSTHERFIGFLIEHYGGKFPVWLAPEQARIIPITENHHDYAIQLEKRLKDTLSVGSIQSALKRLEEKGFLTSKFGEATPKRGGNRKRLYTATPHAQRVLEEIKALRASFWATIIKLNPEG